jgi:hypothetical protein
MSKIKTISVEVDEVEVPLTHGAGARRRRRASARHGGVDVELQHHVVPGLHPGRPPQHVPRGPPERAGAADHRELPDGRRDVVPANHGDGAAVVGPARERHGHGHRQHGLPEGRQRVRPLRAPERPRRRAGALRQGVVYHRGVAEVGARHHGVRRPRALDDLHRRLAGTARNVVHVEAQVDEAAAARRRRRRRRAGGHGEGRHQRGDDYDARHRCGHGDQSHYAINDRIGGRGDRVARSSSACTSAITYRHHTMRAWLCVVPPWRAVVSLLGSYPICHCQPEHERPAGTRQLRYASCTTTMQPRRPSRTSLGQKRLVSLPTRCEN